MSVMGPFEKRFVNSPRHSRRVARGAARMVELAGVQPGQTYLDVGCGNGAAAIELARRYALHATGVDVDPDQIRLAQGAARGIERVRFLTADATRLPFEDGAFDVVATHHATHHIPRWADALAEMLRVLRPGGHLVYADLVVPAWAAAAGRRLFRENAGFPTARALDALMARAGLAPVRRRRSWVRYEAVARRPGGGPGRAEAARPAQ